MNIAGRLRTGSRPSRTSMLLAVYSSRGAPRGGVGVTAGMSVGLQRRGDGRRQDGAGEAVALLLTATRAVAKDVGEPDLPRAVLLRLERDDVADRGADEALALGDIHEDRALARADERRDLAHGDAEHVAVAGGADHGVVVDD